MICHAVGSIWEEHHYDGCFKKQCYVDPNKDNKYTTTTVGAGKQTKPVRVGKQTNEYR